jgi:hypothetical protein
MINCSTLGVGEFTAGCGDEMESVEVTALLHADTKKHRKTDIPNALWKDFEKVIISLLLFLRWHIP